MLNTLIVILTALLMGEPQTQHDQPVELLPGIRVAQGLVEFDATIAINAHHPETPDVYLEMFVTAPDSREHESLVLARIQPSNLHAALLAAGFEPGAPRTINEDGSHRPAHGDRLQITVATATAPDTFLPITDWAVHIESGVRIADDPSWQGLVFAGSNLTARGYEADADGTLISLTTFANEVIAPVWSVSHLAEVDEPVWIANRDLIPKQGTEVVVRIEQLPSAVVDKMEPSHQPERVDIDRDP